MERQKLLQRAGNLTADILEAVADADAFRVLADAGLDAISDLAMQAGENRFQGFEALLKLGEGVGGGGNVGLLFHRVTFQGWVRD